MVTTRPPKTIVKPTALGPVANTDTKLLIYGLFQKGRVLAQDAHRKRGETDRPRLRSTAPALDPTGLPGAEVTDTMGRCDPTRRASCQEQSIQ